MKADWEKRFNDSSLVIQFEYIGATHNYIMLKCKTCGEEFRRGRTILTRTELHACACPKCKHNQFGFKGSITSKPEPEYVQTIIDMYSSGIEQKEITEATGQSYHTVSYWLKKKGLYDPKRRQTGTVRAMQGLAPNNQANIARKQDAENRLAQFLLDKGFKYIDGYDGRNSHFKVQCLTCGGTFTRGLDGHTRKQDHLRCPICDERKRESKQAEEETRHQQWVQQQEEYRQKKIEKANQRQIELNKHFDELHTCPICKRYFSIREYAESIGTDPIFIPNVEYCSKKCRKKATRMSGRSHDHIKRAIKHGCKWEKGVTLTKLIKRDGLRCAICGELCDINDKSWGNGNGPRYPSMDHIIPIAKGGSHTWNNVQVAHMICNSLKNVKIV